MPTAIKDYGFAGRKPGQPVRLALVQGRLVQLPDADQVPAARDCVASRRKGNGGHQNVSRLGNPQETPGGRKPGAVTADSEEGCRSGQRTLVTMAEFRETIFG